MLSNRYISEAIPKELWDRYSQIETDMVLAFAARARDMDFNALWYADRLRAEGILREELEGIIAKNWPGTQKDLANTLEQAGYKALSGEEPYLQKAANAGLLTAAPAIGASVALGRILETGYKRTIDKLNLVNTTAKNTTIETLNKAYTMALTGVQGLDRVIDDAVADLAKRGITGAKFPNGRTMELAPYVRMVVKTSVMQTTSELGFQRLDEYGCDLIQVSAHAGARPLCAPYQGKIYSLSGKHPKYPPFSSTSYGQIAGLFGINCGHYFFPFAEGLDRELTPEEQDPAQALGKTNEQVYNESQEQRYYEHKIREWKQRADAMKGAGIDNSYEVGKVKEWQAEQRAFIERTGRTRLYEREKVGVMKVDPAIEKGIKEATAKAQQMGITAHYGYNEQHLKLATTVNEVFGEVQAKGFPLVGEVGLAPSVFAKNPKAAGAFSTADNKILLNPFSTPGKMADDAIKHGASKFWSSSSPKHVLYHESGHAVSYLSDPIKYDRIKQAKDSGIIKGLNPRISGMVSREVSRYAARDPLELVAEVFAGLMAGNAYNEKIMRLYRAYGGVWE